MNPLIASSSSAPVLFRFPLNCWRIRMRVRDDCFPPDFLSCACVGCALISQPSGAATCPSSVSTANSAAETDSVAGHVGLELGNVGLSCRCGIRNKFSWLDGRSPTSGRSHRRRMTSNAGAATIFTRPKACASAGALPARSSSVRWKAKRRSTTPSSFSASRSSRRCASSDIGWE